MYSYFINLDSGSRLYSISSSYLMDPARLTERTAQIGGLELRLCACDDRRSGDLPYDSLFRDCSEMRGKDAAVTMFQLNLPAAFRGLLGGWNCSGVGIDATDGLKFYFAHSDDRPTPLFSTVRGAIGLMSEVYSYVQLVVKRSMAADAEQIFDLIRDPAAALAVSGAWVDFSSMVRTYLIDFWNPRRSEVYDAAHPDDDPRLLFRALEFWNGLPVEQLEYFRDPTGLPGNARVTKF